MESIIDSAFQDGDVNQLRLILKDLEASEESLDLSTLYRQLKMMDCMDYYLGAKMRKPDLRSIITDPSTNIKKQGNNELSDLLGEQSRILSTFQSFIRDKRNSVAKQINDCSRPHLRPLSLLDMPDEILLAICEEVRNSEYCYETSSIKSLRLTCWRICNISSQFLIERFEVDIAHPDSVSVLEKISRHPIVSKGVRTISVNLRHYSPSLAHDFATFAVHSTRGLSNYLRLMKFWLEVPNRRYRNFPTEAPRSRVKSAAAVLKSWQSFVRMETEFSAYEGDASHRMLLQRGYEQYQQLFADQERLLSNGRLVNAVAAAMARMPLAKTLFLGSSLFRSRAVSAREGFEATSDSELYETLIKRMLVPLDWEQMIVDGLGSPPAELVAESILAIYRAGVLLTDINITLPSPPDHSTLAPSEEDCKELAAAVQRLQCFNFTLNGVEDLPVIARTSEEKAALRRLICALLATESIREIHLDLSCFVNDEGVIAELPDFSIGSIINSPRRPKLLACICIGIPLHISDVRKFVRRRSSNIPQLDMDDAYLISGTWANVLDILRDDRNRASYNIWSPSGAECEFLSTEEMSTIFGISDTSQKRSAWFYMRGEIPKNPLQVSDQSSSEESDEE